MSTMPYNDTIGSSQDFWTEQQSAAFKKNIVAQWVSRVTSFFRTERTGRKEMKNNNKNKERQNRNKRTLALRIHVAPSTFPPLSPLWKQSSPPCREAHMEPHSLWQSGYPSQLKWDASKSCSTHKHSGSNWLNVTGRLNLNTCIPQCWNVISYVASKQGAKSQRCRNRLFVYWL